VEIVVDAVRFALFLFMVVLFARIVLSFVIAFSRDWKPTGFMLVVAEGVFTITDPPLKALRKLIPPLTIGQIRLDLAFLILFFACSLLWQILAVWT
jgi:YggT family protein